MKTALTRLRDQLRSDFEYFQKVYNHTFDFARSEGQRSLGQSHPYTILLIQSFLRFL